MGAVLAELTEKIIGAAIEVHRELGPGLLESTYEVCLCEELKMRGLRYERQVPIRVRYKGVTVMDAYRLDIIVEGQVVLEIKAIESLADLHEAQLLTYLRHTGHRVGLLLNFNVATLVYGLKRVSN